MGYFSNGCEGMDYEERYCRQCVHTEGCAVLELHMMYNYDECNKKDSMLHVLIPRDEKGFNQKCTMFYEKQKGKANGTE